MPPFLSLATTAGVVAKEHSPDTGDEWEASLKDGMPFLGDASELPPRLFLGSVFGVLAIAMADAASIATSPSG